MAGDWFQVFDNLEKAPEVQQIVTSSGVDVDTTLGRLVLLWSWVDQHADPDTERPGWGILPNNGMADICRNCKGDERFWRSVEIAEWVSFTDRGILIPGFDKRFPESAKKRALDAQRKRIERMQHQLEASQPPAPRRRTRRTAAPKPETPAEDTGTVCIEEGAKRLQASVFDKLKLAMLTDTKALLEWWTWACSQPNPVGIDDLYYQERLLAAAERALHQSQKQDSQIKNPVGFVVAVMAKQRWHMIEPEDLSRGKQRLAKRQQLGQQRQGDLRDCLQGPPVDAPKQTLTEMRVAALKFKGGQEQRRKA